MMGTLMFITSLPFCEIFHKRFSLKSTHTYPSHDPCSARLINVNFAEHTLLWIILTFPKNKHSSHQPKEGAETQECHVMADGDSVIVGSESDAGSMGADIAASDSLGHPCKQQAFHQLLALLSSWRQTALISDD